jgi:hypothetical protein
MTIHHIGILSELNSMKRILAGWAVLALLTASSTQARAEIFSYDTTPFWDGTTAISPWGSVQSTNTPTFGQTFIAPGATNSLLSFTFYLTDFTPGDSVMYQAAVYSWSGSLQGGSGPQGAVGSSLFSVNQVFVDNGGFQAVTIDTGGVDLTPGGAYVVLLTTSDPTSISNNSNSLGQFEWGLTGYFLHQPNNGGGGFNFDNNPDINSLPWDDYADYGDLAWTGVFRIVPEPSSFMLVGIGSIAVAVIRRRKTSHSAKATGLPTVR